MHERARAPEKRTGMPSLRDPDYLLFKSLSDGRYRVLTAQSVGGIPCRRSWVRHLLPRQSHFEECGSLNLQSEVGCETGLVSKSRRRRARASAPRARALALD